MYKHIFGPVPSRRLGMSLGVDLVPHKVCSLDCVYCECGATKKLTLDRKEYVLYKNVTAELTDYFENNPDPEFITLSGNGEPTLNIRLGEIIDFIKKLRPNIPLAVLTNGTLLFEPEVREELTKADLVIPSLDAVIKNDFVAVNQPAKNLTLEKYIEGIEKFVAEFSGRIWLEIMIIPDYNDSIENIKALSEFLRKIKVEKIQLNTLDRPGTVPDLRAASIPELKNIVEMLNLPNVEIISSVPERKKMKAYRQDIESAIIETISRRPCTVDDLASILNTNTKDINKYLGVLDSEGKIISERQKRGVFYRLK